MKHYLFIVLIVLIGLLPVQAQEYAVGADLSFLKMSEDNGSEKAKAFFGGKPAVGRFGTRGFFDKEGNVLPVITVFDKYIRH